MQLMLGLETMLSRFDLTMYAVGRIEPIALSADVIRSVHFHGGCPNFLGGGIDSILAHRHVSWVTQPAIVPPGNWRGRYEDRIRRPSRVCALVRPIISSWPSRVYPCWCFSPWPPAA